MLIAGIIIAVLAAVGSIQTMRANKWEREHLQLEGKLEEQRADQDEMYAVASKMRAEYRLELAVEAERREALQEEIKKITKESNRAKVALEEEKKQTATLLPIDVVIDINERIGDESQYTAGGLFIFTRVGVNRTLDLFKDGEFRLAENNRLKVANNLYWAASVSFKASLEASKQTAARYLNGWEDCRETLETALDDRETLKKIAGANIWKGRVQGAVGGSIITIVAGKILGVF